jgi:hypothetical protein|tara:strand:+ start:2165 stop:2389 length:225 start_codon:yes stop_codon:yes gene_type:complete
MKENSVILLLLMALAISQVITFVRLHELAEVSQQLINANGALYEAYRLQHEINILQLRSKSFDSDETIYPLPRN